VPLGKGHRFSMREHRQAMRVKASLKEKGEGDEDAERIAWMTVNKRRKHGIGALKRK
jgi:hypothetical protein